MTSEGQSSTTAHGKHDRETARQHALRVAETIDPILRAGLDVPAGHAYRFDVVHETRWLLGGPGHSLSAFVGRTPRCDEDDKQIDVEIRVFLDHPRANVFAKRGPRFFGQGTGLLGQERFVYAQYYDRLAEAIVERVNAAL